MHPPVRHLRAAGALHAALLSAALLALGGIPLFGCTYSFSGSNLPSYIKSIAIPNFDNETLEPVLSDEVTSGVLDRFMRDQRLLVAPERAADCRLSGRVTKYENKVHNYGPDENPRDYIVVLTVAVALRDQVKNRDLWKGDALTRTAIYVPGGSAPAGSAGVLATEQEARVKVISDLADDLLSRTLEQW